MNNTDDDRLTTAASRLATEISPQRDLWPGIEEAIARPKRSRWTPMFAQAAAVVLLVGASSMVTYFVVKEDQRVVEVALRWALSTSRHMGRSPRSLTSSCSVFRPRRAPMSSETWP
jgi:hypothetical protein